MCDPFTEALFQPLHSTTTGPQQNVASHTTHVQSSEINFSSRYRELPERPKSKKGNISYTLQPISRQHFKSCGSDDESGQVSRQDSCTRRRASHNINFTTHNYSMSEVLTTDFSTQDLTVLERQVLVQYQSLALKLHKLADELQNLHKSTPGAGFSSGQAAALLQNMKGLERKVGLVHTLFRTAVYSLLLQNEESKEGSDETSV